MTYEDTPNAISSQAEGCGQLQLDLPGGPTMNLCGPAPARASRSRSQAKAEVPTTHGICGPTSFASSVPPGPLSSWESRLRERLAAIGSTECALIWREAPMEQGPSISRLAPWTPRTSVKGSTGSPWPTPNTPSGGRKMTFEEAVTQKKRKDGSKAQLNLENAIIHLASPRVTPSARDWKDSAGMATERPDGRTRIDQLPRQMVATWPTVQARDGNKPHTIEYVEKHKANGHGMANLNDHMAFTAATEAGGQEPIGSYATIKKRGAPNPAFPFWLMGFPDEWVSGALRAMQFRRSSRRKSSAPIETPSPTQHEKG